MPARADERIIGGDSSLGVPAPLPLASRFGGPRWVTRVTRARVFSAGRAPPRDQRVGEAREARALALEPAVASRLGEPWRHQEVGHADRLELGDALRRELQGPERLHLEGLALAAVLAPQRAEPLDETAELACVVEHRDPAVAEPRRAPQRRRRGAADVDRDGAPRRRRELERVE